MANLAINALTAKTPTTTDLIPVADPTTGIAGKSTVKQLYESNIFAVSVAYTGIAPAPFGAIVSAKSGSQSGSTLTIPDGVTIETFVYSNGYSTTLTYENLAGIRSTFTMANWASLTSLSFPALAFTGVNFDPNTMAALTTLSTPALTYVGNNFQPNAMASLTTLSTPLLSYVGGNYLPSNMGAITSLSAPALAYIGGSYQPQPGGTSLTTISTPALAYVGVNYYPNQMSGLTTLSAPALVFIGGFFFPNVLASLTSINMPALTSIGVNLARTAFTSGNIQPLTMASLTTLTFPAIEVIGDVSGISIKIVSGTGALSTFTLGSTLRRVNADVQLTSCALLVASVDGVLVRLAALNGTGLTTTYNNKNVTITGTSATPSATGLSAKATLVARGCTVTHN